MGDPAHLVLFIVLGNSSSGGAVAAPLLPGIYAFPSRFVPTAATVSPLHTAVYFRSTSTSARSWSSAPGW